MTKESEEEYATFYAALLVKDRFRHRIEKLRMLKDYVEKSCTEEVKDFCFGSHFTEWMDNDTHLDQYLPKERGRIGANVTLGW